MALRVSQPSTPWEPWAGAAAQRLCARQRARQTADALPHPAPSTLRRAPAIGMTVRMSMRNPTERKDAMQTFDNAPNSKSGCSALRDERRSEQKAVCARRNRARELQAHTTWQRGDPPQKNADRAADPGTYVCADGARLEVWLSSRACARRTINANAANKRQRGSAIALTHRPQTWKAPPCCCQA